MDFVSVNGVVLHYRDSGADRRPVLVFSNSLGTDFRIWDDVVGGLDQRFRIVRYDKRGHGLSETTAAPYALSDHVADLAGLLDRLRVREAIVCGLSVGGMIAQGLLAARPDLVCGLILCDTAHKIGTAEMWNARIEAIEAGGIGALAGPILERWFSAAFREAEPDALAGWRAMLTRTPKAGYLGTCDAIRDADLTEQAKRIRVPTLCVVGDEDGATPPALVRELADLVPGAGFEIVAGAGHLPCIEQPRELTALIDTFVKEHGLA